MWYAQLNFPRGQLLKFGAHMVWKGIIEPVKLEKMEASVENLINDRRKSWAMSGYIAQPFFDIFVVFKARILRTGAHVWLFGHML